MQMYFAFFCGKIRSFCLFVYLNIRRIVITIFLIGDDFINNLPVKKDIKVENFIYKIREVQVMLNSVFYKYI